MPVLEGDEALSAGQFGTRMETNWRSSALFVDVQRTIATGEDVQPIAEFLPASEQLFVAPQEHSPQ